jgi:ceramide glucosyltransferase
MTGGLLLAAAAVCLAFHLATVALFLARPRWPNRATGAIGLPPLTLLRPIRGVDPFDAETLGSSFAQDYPDYEVVLCVDSEDDPAAALARRLIAARPGARARLLVGASAITGNPKLNNLAKGWQAAAHGWICMADSNLLLPPGYLRSVVAAWDAGCGLVSCPPVGARPEGLAGRLECAFLNGNQARLQFAADSLGLGFAQGKTLLWNRAMLDAAGGIAALGRDLAEDVNATKLVRARGLHVRLTPRPFAQPIGRRAVGEVWRRQLRWSRLRRAGFPAIFALEILNGPLVPLAALGAGALLLGGAPAAPALAAFAALWYGAEALLLRRSGWPSGLRDLAVLPIRDLLLPVIWVASFLGGDIAWRGNAVAEGRGMSFR